VGILARVPHSMWCCLLPALSALHWDGLHVGKPHSLQVSGPVHGARHSTHTGRHLRLGPQTHGLSLKITSPAFRSLAARATLPTPLTSSTVMV